jgi:hypothetical protein
MQEGSVEEQLPTDEQSLVYGDTPTQATPHWHKTLPALVKTDFCEYGTSDFLQRHTP